MTRAAGSEGIILNLDFLSEPALIVDIKGGVRSANSAARHLLRMREAPVNLFDVVQNSADDVATYLRRASASTSSHVGSITLAHGEGAERFRALAARMQGDLAETLLIVRLMPVRDDQFSVLNRRLREMDLQLHQRLKENAMLQEALAENRVLVRELQHRVKNNIQQMLSLIKMSAADRRSPDVEDVVMTASHRLQAMAMTQEALYQKASAGSISARSFLENVVRGGSFKLRRLGRPRRFRCRRADDVGGGALSRPDRQRTRHECMQARHVERRGEREREPHFFARRHLFGSS